LVTFATPGPLGFYLGESVNGPPTLGMATYPLPFARYRSFFTDGVTLAAVGLEGFRSSVLPPTIKHRSRMFWHVADHKARKHTRNPNALALAYILPAGLEFTETSVANFLVVIEGGVVSPPRDQILDGISLRVTKELCGTLGIPFVEAPLTLTDLDASEATLTGTAFCLAGVKELFNVRHQQFDWPGPVFRKLLAAWSDLVGVDIAKQFTG
jgi:branched-chain amino acid aminotransferase